MTSAFVMPACGLCAADVRLSWSAAVLHAQYPAAISRRFWSSGQEQIANISCCGQQTPFVVAVFSATERILATSSASAALGLDAVPLVAGCASHENTTLLLVLVVTRLALSPMPGPLRCFRTAFVSAGLAGALAPLRFRDGGPPGGAAGGRGCGRSR